MAFNFHLNSLFVFLNGLVYVYSQSEPNCYMGEMAQKLNERFLKEHNEYRNMHSVPALQLDPTLMEESMKWSQQLARDGKIETSTSNEVGENLYGILNVGHLDESLLQPSKAWYMGKEKYTGNFSVDSGHFTQMVWKSTQKMGCGVCSGANLTALTCRYMPPGNILSEQQFKENVLPAIILPSESSMTDTKTNECT